MLNPPAFRVRAGGAGVSAGRQRSGGRPTPGSKDIFRNLDVRHALVSKGYHEKEHEGTNAARYSSTPTAKVSSMTYL